MNQEKNIGLKALMLITLLLGGLFAINYAEGRIDENSNNTVNVSKTDDWNLTLVRNGGENNTKATSSTQVAPSQSKLAQLLSWDKENKEDDWVYEAPKRHREKFGGVMALSAPQVKVTAAPMLPTADFAANESLGFAVGGANDINNFRENIEHGYLPIPTDITYEGLFYDYYFNLENDLDCSDLFCPTYSTAISNDPISGTEKRYIAVGLDSGIQASDFERKKLNLVVVLDISGSMSAPFSEYYYDSFGNQVRNEEYNSRESKMDVAKDSINALLKNLEDEDRFGMVLFDDDAYLAKPLNLVGETDMRAISDHIDDLSPQGGTHMSSGMEMATGMFDEYLSANQDEYENRIIFLTDAMPNRGETSRGGLLAMTEGNAEKRLYTTFIGIGVDFNTELTEHIATVKGAGYYSVHNAKEFEQRMDDEFDYMVTPLVFDLTLSVQADGYKIAKVYGSPQANESTGELMKVNTLFPASSSSEGNKGGIILLELEKTGVSDEKITLIATYQDRNGISNSNVREVQFQSENEHFENSGIRKGVLLSRYANLLQNWVIDERSQMPVEYTLTDETGIIAPPPYHPLGEWERQSTPLRVSTNYQQLISIFREHFGAEAAVIGDSDLNQELELMETLVPTLNY